MRFKSQSRAGDTYVIDHQDNSKILALMFQKHQYLDTIRHKGWIKRRVGFGVFKNWKRQFLSLR